MWSTVFEVLLCLALVHFWIKHRLSHWKRNGVCSVKSVYLLGNMKKFWKRPFCDLTTDCYRKLRNKDVIGGFYCFLRPMLMVMDPALIGHVLCKDHGFFASRGLYHNAQTEPMSVNLMTIEGQGNDNGDNDRWKELRGKITPTVTADKLKLMVETLVQVGHVVQLMTTPGKPIELRELCSQLTLDGIGKCGFGIDPGNSKFQKLVRKVAKQQQSMGHRLKMIFVDVFGELSRCLGIRMVDEATSQFFERLIEERTRSNSDNKESDMVNTLLEISSTGLADVVGEARTDSGGDRKNGVKQSVVGKLTLQEVCAQSMLFSIGHGYEATATTMEWCLYELARNAAVQDKLTDEVDRVLQRHQERISYEAIQEMAYLDQVVKGEFLFFLF